MLLAALLALAPALRGAAAAAAATDALSAALAAVPFGNALTGLTNNSDAYGVHALQCYYLEVENVSCTSCSWGGACAVQTLLPSGSPPPSQGCSAQSPAAPNTDRPGGDMGSAPSANYSTCAAECCANSQCVAWVFVTSLQAKREDQCVTGGTCCWQKSSVPGQVPSNYPGGIWSGTATQVSSGDVVPPTGIRNAVPVGGLGAGTMELRGDGTFHELTFHSASPGGAAKYATQPDMIVAYKAGGGAARAVKTAPQPWAAPGVAQLAYRGTYPVSRLDIADPSSLGAAGLSASLYFYHHLRPNDSPTSAAPAAVLTLVVTNTGAAAANISLLFQMPMAAMRDCERVDFKQSSNATLDSYAACLHACGAGCGAWNYDSVSGVCALLPSAGRMVYKRGAFCGVRGAWDSSDGQMLTLAMHPGDAPSEAGPAVGDVSLRPVASGGDAAALSFGVSDDPAAIFAAFSAQGGFAPGVNGGVTGGSFAAVQAAHGAVAVTSPMVSPGETASVSVTLSWFFPNRDYYGMYVGQFYTSLFGSSKDVAGLYSNEHLVSVASDAAAHASVFAGAGSASLPAWLSDHMVNQFSHARNFIYAAISDGSSDSGGGMMVGHSLKPWQYKLTCARSLTARRPAPPVDLNSEHMKPTTVRTWIVYGISLRTQV